ncbi:hypothetical protein Gpo141_00014026 [Globisporangium polare]
MKIPTTGSFQRVPSSASVKNIRQGSKKLGHQSSALASGVASFASRSRGQQKISLEQLVRALRRLLVVAATAVYIQISISACMQSVELLHISMTPPMDYYSYDSVMLAKAAGSTTIRESPLVMDILGGNTSPRNGSLFIEEDLAHYSDGCVSANASVIYTDEFQRRVFAALVSSLTYNLTYLDPRETELVMPVIDCTLTALAINDPTAPRFFFLMRKVKDPDDVYVFTVTIGVQGFQVAKQKTSGPVAISTITFINDMRATDIEHSFAVVLGLPFKDLVLQRYEYYGLTDEGFWLLKSVPEDPKTEASKIISTTCPTGSYISSEKEQSTVVYLNWRLQQDPKEVLTHWT